MQVAAVAEVEAAGEELVMAFDPFEVADSFDSVAVEASFQERSVDLAASAAASFASEAVLVSLAASSSSGCFEVGLAGVDSCLVEVDSCPVEVDSSLAGLA